MLILTLIISPWTGQRVVIRSRDAFPPSDKSYQCPPRGLPVPSRLCKWLNFAHATCLAISITPLRQGLNRRCCNAADRSARQYGGIISGVRQDVSAS
ncbi:hypothetical protein CEXT_315071 [Caerostris extrusa]|uniref:Uncharacterized protein n=1 Tax=Caerostris extrusa TaxID=172846 RepID=A0AAV4N9R3_CAEEX|nr:hypothetical protein CEXT_315071 [Caerostris extrusa]